MPIPRTIQETNHSSLPPPGGLAGTLHEWLLAACCFSCLLLVARVVITGTTTYIFLFWNLFLAFVPYWITGSMIRNRPAMNGKIKWVVALLSWLLFIPNSFYIITDLFHLSNPVITGLRSAPPWFDLLLIFSFAWNGILFGVLSLRRVEVAVALLWRRNFSILLVFAVMWLCGFGIYIGRFLRYNSWDVITDPFSLAAEIAGMMIHPFENGQAWGMTICYAIFMTLVYLTIKKLGERFLLLKEKSPGCFPGFLE